MAIKKYFKYGTEIDANVVGNFARIDKGIASGFSSTNWLVLPENFNPDSNSWEAVAKFNLSSLGIERHLFNSSGIDYQPFHVAVRADNLVEFRGYTNNTATELFFITGTTILETGKDYYIKAVYNNKTGYELSLSTDGISYALEGTSPVVTPIDSGHNVVIGADFSSTGYYAGAFTGGSIDLSQSYININGERWWSGDEYIKVGSWISDAVVSGFSDSNYLTLPDTLNVSNGQTWEKVFKFTTGGDVTTQQSVIGCYGDGKGSIVQIQNSLLKLYVSSGSSWDIASAVYGAYTVLSNTTYWLKLEFTGSSYIVYYSLDGLEFTPDIAVSSTKYMSADVMRFGDTYASGQYFNGSIDLNESYIKINDKMWWHGTKAYEVTASDDYDYYELVNLNYTTKRKTIKYYKDVTEYEAWTQPKATSNTTAIDGGNMVFTDSYKNSDTAAWKAMNGSNSSNKDLWTNNGSGSAWWQVEFPYVLKITGLKQINGTTTSTARNVNGRFYTDSTKATPIGNAISTPNTNLYETTVSGIPSEGILTDTIYFQKTGGGAYGGIGELKITATKPVTSTIGTKDVPFTFPELTSEGSIGGDEFGVVADGEVTGLINMFQPLADGKPANGVYTDVSGGSSFILYSPVPFYYRGVTLYYGVDEDGAVMYPDSLDISISCLDENGNWIAVWNFWDYTPKETPYHRMLVEGIHIADAQKYYRFEPFGQTQVKIGKLIIHGLVEEPLTADDGYYQQDGKWENPKLTLSLTTNLVELIWNTDKGGYTTYVSANDFSKAAVNDLLYQYTADGVSVQNPEFLVRKIGDSSTNALSYRLESQIYAVPEITPNIVKRKTREYYKTISNVTDWVQPVLTSNGTMGGDSFACAASDEFDLGLGGGPNYAYYAFDNNANSIWWGNRSISWYNPVPLIISEIEISYGLWTGAGNSVLQYSDNNSDWHTVESIPFVQGTDYSAKNVVINLSSNNVSAKYWRIYKESESGGQILNIKITAQTGTTTTIEGTADDYDFYEDKIKTYSIRR